MVLSRGPHRAGPGFLFAKDDLESVLQLICQRNKGSWANNVKYEYCHKTCSIIFLQKMQYYATYVQVLS